MGSKPPIWPSRFGNVKQSDDQRPPRAAEKGFYRLWTGALCLLAGSVLAFSVGCALPPASARQAQEISGTVSNVDVDGRFFHLENEGQRPRTIYRDDSTRFFSSGGREFAPSKAERMLGESVAVLAVPMGGIMIANSCNEL